ncbi:phosphopantetheine-binding protein [Actinoplanes sp. NPDC020271]|uniref:phosphopantetheine-binding protein n=1 Tax=Actinoplanes sp. NPDC020271 TaxID=3363896 RepID=UPI00378A98C1
MNPIVEDVLRRHLTYLPAGAPLDPGADLKDLGLDSMKAVELVFDLEDELGVALPDEMMNAKTFSTAGDLEAALGVGDQLPVQ